MGIRVKPSSSRGKWLMMGIVKRCANGKELRSVCRSACKKSKAHASTSSSNTMPQHQITISETPSNMKDGMSEDQVHSSSPTEQTIKLWALSSSFDYGSKIAYFIALFLYFSLDVWVNFFKGLKSSLAWWTPHQFMLQMHFHWISGLKSKCDCAWKNYGGMISEFVA